MIALWVAGLLVLGLVARLLADDHRRCRSTRGCCLNARHEGRCV